MGRYWSGLSLRTALSSPRIQLFRCALRVLVPLWRGVSGTPRHWSYLTRDIIVLSSRPPAVTQANISNGRSQQTLYRKLNEQSSFARLAFGLRCFIFCCQIDWFVRGRLTPEKNVWINKVYKNDRESGGHFYSTIVWGSKNARFI
jgi:hypothetical protein